MPPLRPIVRRYADTVSPHDPGGRRRRECWEATSQDGLWGFERIEEPGTPWIVYYKPGAADQELCPGLFGTLNRAREAVEVGWVKPPSMWLAEHAAGHDRRWAYCPACQHQTAMKGKQ